ncbi:MAG: hypothetical protein CMJ25_22990 [Phycisphaerae bacterium]|nr:hypothetical protein [Phycisphaerae bacterium]
MSKIKGRIDNAAHTGRIGEFFAMYVLERYGIECHHVDRSGVDLWCQSYYEDMFTLQVKAANLANLNRKDRNPEHRYLYNLASQKIADFYMFIALDEQRVIIKPTEELGRKLSMQVHPNKFTEEAEKEGLDLLRNFRRVSHPLGQ